MNNEQFEKTETVVATLRQDIKGEEHMSISAMKQALEALEEIYRTGDTQAFDLCYAPNVIPALRQAIAEAEQPDLARVGEVGVWGEWVGLTDEEAAECWSTSAVQTWKHIEAKLKEKNT